MDMVTADDLVALWTEWRERLSLVKVVTLQRGFDITKRSGVLVEFRWLGLLRYRLVPRQRRRTWTVTAAGVVIGRKESVDALFFRRAVLAARHDSLMGPLGGNDPYFCHLLLGASASRARVDGGARQPRTHNRNPNHAHTLKVRIPAPAIAAADWSDPGSASTT